MKSSHLLLFELTGRSCALDLQQVLEVIPITATDQIPAQPSILDGFLNLRGQAVPVIKLAQVLNAENNEIDTNAHIVVVQTEHSRLGLLVDKVDSVIELKGSEPRSAIPSHLSFNGCAEFEVAIHDRQVTIISAPRVLLQMEQECIAELGKSAQARLDALLDSRA